MVPFQCAQWRGHGFFEEKTLVLLAATDGVGGMSYVGLNEMQRVLRLLKQKPVGG